MSLLATPFILYGTARMVYDPAYAIAIRFKYHMLPFPSVRLYPWLENAIL
jgi:hypothetical protein